MSLTTYNSSAYKSGTGTATSTATAIGSGELNGHLMIQVLSTEAAGVEVIAIGSSTGIIVEPGKEIPFLADDLAKVLVKRVGGADIDFNYWAF